MRDSWWSWAAARVGHIIGYIYLYVLVCCLNILINDLIPCASLGLSKLQKILSLMKDYDFKIQRIAHVRSAEEAYLILSSIEQQDPQARKYVVLDCENDVASQIIIKHVRDIYMGTRNYHFLLTSLVSRWTLSSLSLSLSLSARDSLDHWVCAQLLELNYAYIRY